MGPRASVNGVVAGQSACSHVSAVLPKVVRVTYISGELSVVQITLEDNELGRLQLLVQLGVLRRQSPETTTIGPVSVRSKGKLSFRMERSPLLE